MLVLCLSRVSRVFSSRYPFSCHVVPFPLFRPSLTRVYEKQLFLPASSECPFDNSYPEKATYISNLKRVTWKKLVIITKGHLQAGRVTYNIKGALTILTHTIKSLGLGLMY